MKYYVEVTPTSRHSVPTKLIPIEELGGVTGFRSVYEYPEVTKAWIENQYHNEYNTLGTTVGIGAAKMPVSSSVLFVDFDGDKAEVDAKKLCADLRSMGVAYCVYLSGSKGYHVHILCERKTDWRVPISQQTWISGWAEYRDAVVDTSIYRPNSLIRLVGTIHATSGRKKELVDQQLGKPLTYQIVDNPVVTNGAPEDEANAISSLYRIVLQAIEPGGRRQRISLICKKARDLGIGLDEALDLCYYFNNRLPTPLDEGEVEEKVYKSF